MVLTPDPKAGWKPRTPVLEILESLPPSPPLPPPLPPRFPHWRERHDRERQHLAKIVSTAELENGMGVTGEAWTSLLPALGSQFIPTLRGSCEV